jgi:serine/threonine protein kinase
MSSPTPSSSGAAGSDNANTNKPNPARVKEIFDVVVEARTTDRAAMLDPLCGDDAPLKAEVQALLDAHDQAGDFLSAPAVISAEPKAAAGSTPIGNIGPYRILRSLGEGGYGTVYLAEQEKPLRRTVALKIIKAGMDTQQVIARFELERQTLAMMDHPHIARVYDAGSTDAGRPYFVMEYVDGQPVTTYCRSKNLGLDDRLAIFDHVCAAVQHAHRKAIIHRDLKPSNVLVATVDGNPVPKIIDFGIAKALHASGPADPMLTQQALFIGTPQYMSPEQAQGPSADIDTRSDVYSLGVLLYELLTDSPPIDPEKIRQAMLADVPKLIREIEPPPPSSRLRTRGRTLAPDAAKSAAPSHDHSISRSADRVRGDLDWIVMKALEKDPDRRYASAEALAADLARYRRDEPVTAGPPSRAYRFRKFARRNRRWIATGTIVLASLVIGLGVATVALFHAQSERDHAVRSAQSEAQQRQIAERERISAQNSAAEAKAHAAKVFAAQTFLYRMISPPFDDDGSSVPPRNVLDYIEARAGDGFLANHPEVEGPLRLGLGSAYLSSDAPQIAERQYRRAVELFRRMDGSDSLNLAAALHNMGTAILRQNDAARARPALEESLAMYRRILHGDKIASALVLAHVGICMARTGEAHGGEPYLTSAIDIFKADRPDHPQIALCQKWLAEVYDNLGEKEKADQMRRQAASADSPPKVPSARADAIDWIRKNMAFGPDSTLPQAVADDLQKQVKSGQNFSILVGGDLLKSHQTTRVSSIFGQLVVVSMSDEQSDAMGYKRKSFAVSSQGWQGRRLPPEVTLDMLNFDRADEWDGRTPLTGRVVIRPLKPLEPGDYELRLSYTIENKGYICFCPFDPATIAPDKPITFQFKPIPAEATDFPTPPAIRAAYLDLCRIKEEKGQTDIAVISKTEGFLLTAPPKQLRQVRNDAE